MALEAVPSAAVPLIPVAKPIIGEEEQAAVARVMASGMLAQGPEVAAFEQEFSRALADGRTCVAVNSGTSGLHLALLAAGIGPGDEVIVPSFTFAATANSVALTGATPVFADIDLDTFCLEPSSVEAAITPRTAAIMPVHLFGQPAPMEELELLAVRHGLAVFEDAAQAHGASLSGRLVGTFGRAATFSLYPTKNMTSGEGGMVAVADADDARRLRLLRNQGMERQYQNEVIGFNARMTDLHAAIGRVQLRRLPEWTSVRQRNARYLDDHLRGVVTPVVREGVSHVYHQYTIRVEDDRDGFISALREEFAVAAGVYYPTPSHRLPSLAPFAVGIELPTTDAAAAQVISLPIHPSLAPADLDRIVDAVNSVAEAGR